MFCMATQFQKLNENVIITIEKKAINTKLYS